MDDSELPCLFSCPEPRISMLQGYSLHLPYGFTSMFARCKKALVDLRRSLVCWYYEYNEGKGGRGKGNETDRRANGRA